MPYEKNNGFSSNFSKAGSNSQIRCFTYGKRGHSSYACPQRRVHLTEAEEEVDVEGEPIYDDDNVVDDEVDVYPVQRGSLVV